MTTCEAKAAADRCRDAGSKAAAASQGKGAARAGCTPAPEPAVPAPSGPGPAQRRGRGVTTRPQNYNNNQSDIFTLGRNGAIHVYTFKYESRILVRTTGRDVARPYESPPNYNACLGSHLESSF